MVFTNEATGQSGISLTTMSPEYNRKYVEGTRFVNVTHSPVLLMYSIASDAFTVIISVSDLYKKSSLDLQPMLKLITEKFCFIKTITPFDISEMVVNFEFYILRQNA